LLTKEDAVEILTPAEKSPTQDNLGFRISPSHCSKENPIQGFVAYARKNGLILRYVGENGIDCIRVSTHYYNQESEIDRFFELLKGYAWNE
jgi:selenocysteine lyase/cysteine desulfurase